MVGGSENFGALLLKRKCSTEMHCRLGRPADTRVAMLMVVPLEESAQVPAGGLQPIEARTEIGPVLERFGLCFQELVVVAHPRSR